MYGRILVAVDGSDTAQLALRQAIELARGQRSRLRLMHVVDELTGGGQRAATLDEFWRAARIAGERILESAQAQAAKAGVEAETKLVENRTFGAVIRRVSNLIVDEAKRWPADLVVIGSHGRRGLSKLLLGSVADGVLRTSPAPVLLIRGAEPRARRTR
jgi:nucleotide-binding universal stress UspA family protein